MPSTRCELIVRADSGSPKGPRAMRTPSNIQHSARVVLEYKNNACKGLLVWSLKPGIEEC